MDQLADRLEVRGEGNGGIEDDSGFWLLQPQEWRCIYWSRDDSEHRFLEGNLDLCFDLVKLDMPRGHMEEMSSMKVDVWLEVISHSGLEIDLETLSRGLDVGAEA